MSDGAKSRRQSALLLASLGSDDPSVATAFGERLEAQAYAVACLLPEGWQVLHALRYGTPSIEQSIAKIDECIEELFVVPMYPQYSERTTGTILREVYRVLGESNKPCDLVTRTQWHNEKYHDLMIKGKQTIDQDQRAKIYQEALQLIYDECPVISVAHSTVIWPATKNVTNFKLHPTGSVRMKNVWLN